MWPIKKEDAQQMAPEHKVGLVQENGIPGVARISDSNVMPDNHKRDRDGCEYYWCWAAFSTHIYIYADTHAPNTTISYMGGASETDVGITNLGPPPVHLHLYMQTHMHPTLQSPKQWPSKNSPGTISLGL